MELLFNQEEIWNLEKRAIARDARQEGHREGIEFYNELIKQLAALGRIGELAAAATDSAKLSALAKEFGLN